MKLQKLCSQKCCSRVYTFGFEIKASYLCPIQLVTTGKPVHYYFTSTVDKTHHGLAIACFSVQLLQFCDTPEVSL